MYIYLEVKIHGKSDFREYINKDYYEILLNDYGYVTTIRHNTKFKVEYECYFTF